jgi:hypothetical protein
MVQWSMLDREGVTGAWCSHSSTICWNQHINSRSAFFSTHYSWKRVAEGLRVSIFLDLIIRQPRKDVQQIVLKTTLEVSTRCLLLYTLPDFSGI